MGRGRAEGLQGPGCFRLVRVGSSSDPCVRGLLRGWIQRVTAPPRLFGRAGDRVVRQLALRDPPSQAGVALHSPRIRPGPHPAVLKSCPAHTQEAASAPALRPRGGPALGQHREGDAAARREAWSGKPDGWRGSCRCGCRPGHVPARVQPGSRVGAGLGTAQSRSRSSSTVSWEPTSQSAGCSPRIRRASRAVQAAMAGCSSRSRSAWAKRRWSATTIAP